MSEKRPILEVRNRFGELYVARDGITVLTEGDPCDEALIHGVVRAWNAMILAGVTPEALARDPECLRKLVTAARAACHGLGTNEVGEALRTCGIEVNQ